MQIFNKTKWNWEGKWSCFGE